MNDKFSRKIFCDGMRDGFPIALGYFAVSFSLGIAARHAGFTPMQGFLASLLNNASAGEYAAFTLVAAQATYLEVAIIIPPARKSKIVAALVAISFALSFVCNYLPGVSSLSEGTRTILLTVIISGAAAILFPVKQADEIIDKPVDKGRESVADNSAECTGKGGLTNE